MANTTQTGLLLLLCPHRAIESKMCVGPFVYRRNPVLFFLIESHTKRRQTRRRKEEEEEIY